MLLKRLNSTAQYDLSQKMQEKKEGGGATGGRALKPFILVSPKLTASKKFLHLKSVYKLHELQFF